jgi:nitroreductase
VRDPAVREALFPTRMAWAAAAPVAIVACSRPSTAWTRAYDGKNHADIDLAILMDHLILAATDDGLATCWICAFDPAVVRAALHLPDDLEPVAITPLGHADAPPREKTRKCLAETVTWV